MFKLTFKNTFIASFFTAITLSSFSVAQAEEVTTLSDYRDDNLTESQWVLSQENSQEPNLPNSIENAQQSSESEEIEDTDLESPDRERKREIDQEDQEDQEEKSGGISGYAGATFGIFFIDVDESRPFFTGNDTDVNTGFGGSLFSGIRFNRYLATDIEISAIGGDIDSDLDEDESYTMWSLFLNPRFTLPLTSKKNSVSLYLSPGIGVSQFSSSVEDEIADLDRTTTIEDDTRFVWQIKGGVSVPVSKKFSVLAQLKYISQTGDNAIDYWGPELGINFDF
ncbi:MAG: hypothetical protein Tsb0014_29650 [Pleurocapsa sp.]